LQKYSRAAFIVFSLALLLTQFNNCGTQSSTSPFGDLSPLAACDPSGGSDPNAILITDCTVADNNNLEITPEGGDIPVNAAAAVDHEGFGGHTPIFNAIVSDAYVNGRQRDAYMIKRLLDAGADIHVKVNLRKFLDWIEVPGWYIAKNVTPLGWASDFPEKGWVNREGVSMIENINHQQ